MATSTSQDYALQAIKGIRKVYQNAVQYDLNTFRDQRIVEFYNTDEFSEIFTSTEGMNGVKDLAERETPPTLALEDGYSITVTEGRFGGAIEITETMFRQAKDNTTKIDKFLREQQNQLLQTNRNYILNFAFYMLDEADNASAETLAPDGQPLLGTHNWKSGGSFNNLAGGTLTSGRVDTAIEYGGSFTDPSGKKMPLNFDTIIVKKGGAASRTAKKLFASDISPTTVDDVNIYAGEHTIIETPYIASGESWFMRDSGLPNSVRVGMGETPSLDEPIIQNNKSMRVNSTGFIKRAICNLPFDWYGYVGS